MAVFWVTKPRGEGVGTVAESFDGREDVFACLRADFALVVERANTVCADTPASRATSAMFTLLLITG